jgi:uncharacterized C2H2 Zn-finger protein
MYAMKRSPLAANYEITTMPDQSKSYKCLLCDNRPVKRETSFLNHWVRNHTTTWDYTMEIWKEKYLQCGTCSSYFTTPDNLKMHISRNHNSNKNNSKEAIEMLETKAIAALYALSKTE